MRKMACQRFFVLKINTVCFQFSCKSSEPISTGRQTGLKPKHTSYVPNKVSFAWNFYFFFHSVPATNIILRGFCFINHLRVIHLKSCTSEKVAEPVHSRNICYLKMNTNLDLQRVCPQCCVCGEVP